MHIESTLQPTPEYFWIEIARVGRKIVEEFFPIKPGENVVVTADTLSDWRIVQETVKAIYAAGATPTLIVHPTTPLAASDPPRPVVAAVQHTDAWIDFSVAYLLYSNAWTKAMQAGVRYFILPGDVDSLVKMVGRVNYAVLDALANKLAELSEKGQEMRITSTLGTDIRVKVDPTRSEGHIFKLGGGKPTSKDEGWTQVPPGQATIGHVFDSVEGTLVFDGTIWPPQEIGALREPVRLEVSKGQITKVSGGQEARILERWLARFNHPGMYQIDHLSYGFNPGVKRCNGEIGHDERVFGCIEFGVGSAWTGAPSHWDGVVLEPSIWADDVQIEQDGKYVHPELVELARQLGVEGYS
jgi:leucyl aminopeptidase (aminopeptidase T)